MDAETKEEFDKLLSISENNQCIDCNVSNPKWASVNNGCFICIDCAGNHRSMGVHISFVRSITMDAWSNIQLLRIQNGGNAKLKQFWETQKFFEFKNLTPKERLDNEAMDKYRDNLLKLAKNEEIEDIAFIGYKEREKIVNQNMNKNKKMKGIGNATYHQPQKPKTKKANKIFRYGIKATLALTRTTETDEPEEITAYKLQLKDTKNWSLEVEEIISNLYMAQNKYAETSKQFETSILKEFANNDDKTDTFSIFLNNIGQSMKNMEEIYEIYLMNMEDQLIKPLREFNKKEIEKCQKQKVKLKTVKGSYDIATSHHNNDEITDKDLNKLGELQLVRSEFIMSVMKMQQYREKELLSSIQSYFQSFGYFSSEQARILRENENKMLETHDYNEKHMVIKEGWMKKRGGGKKSSKFKKRYFKLFTNKKLAYYAKQTSGAAKGHANLTFIQMKKMEDGLSFSVQTQTRLWVFQCDTRQERDEWHNIIEIRCIKDKTIIDQSIEDDSNDVFSDDDNSKENNDIQQQ